ncbi:protein MROH8-like [Dermochelys coriacea]|uniref:protein MROH8-like n=1 Tax=Dermochelys coriacea TaxID=27794 RepID=UPI001CA886BF|nr:protein MROH8-like [Dermochelys coriacea]
MDHGTSASPATAIPLPVCKLCHAELSCLSFQMSVTFEDVAMYFSPAEWTLLGEEQRHLYRHIMWENYQTLVSLGIQTPKPVVISNIERGEELCVQGPTEDEDEDVLSGTRPGTARDAEDEEEEDWVDVVTEEAALKNIREQVQGQEKDEVQQLLFLQAIHPASHAAQQRGQDMLEPHCCKAAVVERIVELIEELPDGSPPGAVLANSLIPVGNLSTMTPALEPELETHLLRAALHAVFTLGTEKATTQVQDLHRVLPDLLDAMLGNLLAESPDTNRFHYILENSAQFPRMGHHVAQLALFVGDPAKDISRQARETVYWLYQLLLHQRGLTIHEAEDLWVWDWHQDSRLLGYKNTARVGEVFGKFFSEGQRRFFLGTALLAIHHPLLCVS